MSPEVHFVQGGDGPVLAGSGGGVLACACGSVLIDGFQAAQFLGVGIKCGRCGVVTATAGVPEGRMPPAALIAAGASMEPRVSAMTVADGVAVVGQAELDRLGALLRPVTPADSVYVVSRELLDRAEAASGILPAVAGGISGLREHALAWSIRHLRERVGDASWRCMEDAPTANAVTHVAGFLHFVATWSRHPLFPVMFETAAERGFSLHGLALFAGAHAMALSGNRVGFRPPSGYPERFDSFEVATGGADVAQVHLGVFDRFEFPFGRPWDAVSLRDAVSEVVAAAQGRINVRHPGVLLLSPGSALGGFDEALIEATKVSMQALGRKNRGLMAVSPIVLRLQALADPHAVRFGYGLFPVRNSHWLG